MGNTIFAAWTAPGYKKARLSATNGDQSHLKSKRKPCLWRRFPSRNGGLCSLWIKTGNLEFVLFSRVNLAEWRKAYRTGFLKQCFAKSAREPT